MNSRKRLLTSLNHQEPDRVPIDLGSTQVSGIHLNETLTDALARIRRHRRAFDDRFPTVGEGTRYRTAANDHWLAGFWPGLLWLACTATADADLCGHAEALLPSFKERLAKRVHITHDLGFLFTLSARAQWQVTGDRAARSLALEAARHLLARYRLPGKYIQAWGQIADPDEGGRMIIDTMMNLPLLFWASAETGDPQYRQAAVAHAETSARYLLRPDGSTYHTYFLDQESGAPLGPRTHQGYADDSLWARGQAWAIYGFAVAAEWSGDPRFLETAQSAALRFIAELPPDGVPWWDLRLPEEAPHFRDSSAGAIAAAGMLRLARFDAAGEAGSFRRSALALLKALVAHCFEVDPEGQGLLHHATYHAHKGWGVDAYLICGDYFFLEALLALHEQAPDFWGPIDASQQAGSS
jgi:unsaturated chondroitin disaccharide hydrolase